VAVSRLGHRLVYATLASDWNIWGISVPAKGAAGPPVRLISSVLSDMAPQYAPDGKRIVFASGRSGHMEIWVCDRDGTKAEQLTSLAAHSGTPRWSPDSQRIVFDSNKEGRFQIYVVDATGGVPQRLTTTPVDDAAPSFSGDGKWIYFSSRQSGRWEVWKMATGGGETVQITRGGGFSPFESHNGKLVYYQKLEDDSEVWSVPAETGTETKVLDSVGGRKFAVTGSGIYFMTVPPGSADYHLRFFEFATKSTRDIAQISKPLFLGLTVSPDGQSVLYTQGDQFGSNLTLVENFR
jgi:dipeptidyl aminopeptidase/acylaminoacyl peptidase